MIIFSTDVDHITFSCLFRHSVEKHKWHGVCTSWFNIVTSHTTTCKKSKTHLTDLGGGTNVSHGSAWKGKCLDERSFPRWWATHVMGKERTVVERYNLSDFMEQSNSMNVVQFCSLMMEWCQLNALQASPVVHLMTPLSCVSLSMNTQPSVPTIGTSELVLYNRRGTPDKNGFNGEA